MPKKYIVNLSDDERQHLTETVSKGKNSAQTIRRANILLAADDGLPNKDIASRMKCGLATISRTKQRYVEKGVEGVLSDKQRPGQPEKLDGKAKAHLVALACSEPPDGRSAWTLTLLGDRLVELNLVESISPNCVRSYLKKTNVSLGSTSSGVSGK